jgi:ribosomal protein S19E (S16A)
MRAKSAVLIRPWCWWIGRCGSVSSVLRQVFVDHVVGQAAEHVASRFGAETHRETHRFFQRHALMRKTRRDVQNVAGQQLGVDDGLERVGV